MPKNKKVLEQLSVYYDYTPDNATLHIDERQDRLAAYDEGLYLDAFVVDTDHDNGLEVHIVDTLGYIHIYNQDSKKHITTLSGRPAQILMYYRQLGIEVDDAVEEAIVIAHERNKNEGANEI